MLVIVVGRVQVQLVHSPPSGPRVASQHCSGVTCEEEYASANTVQR